jgi:ParB family chromosome partitioning protein
MTTAPEFEWVDVKELTLFPGNARRGQVEKIRESIRENGFFDPLTVQRSTGHIITGNHSYRAALDEGMTRVPVVWQDVTDARALKMNLAHNKLSDDATYDVDDLIDQLQTVDDLDGTGWSEEELAELLGDDGDDDLDEDEDLGVEKTPQAVQCPQCSHTFDPNLNRVDA